MAIDMPPSLRFTSCKFGLQTNSQTFTSPLTKNTQRALLGGALWTATYSLPKMNKQQASIWKAFFLQLDGMVNTFNAYDPDNLTPRGSALGTPTVDGGGQTGTSLATLGWTPSQRNLLLPGDYFSVNGQLLMVTQPVGSNPMGAATISFRSALRASPANGAPLILSRPTCTMILADDQQAIWECDLMGFYEAKTFTAIEVFS